MTRPLSNFQLAAYSGVSLPAAAMGMPIAVYLPRFYSEGLGIIVNYRWDDFYPRANLGCHY